MPRGKEANAGLAKHKCKRRVGIDEAKVFTVLPSCLFNEGEQNGVIDDFHVVFIGPARGGVGRESKVRRVRELGCKHGGWGGLYFGSKIPCFHPMSMQPPLGIDHIAIAVPDLDEATSYWSETMGLRAGSREIIESQGVEVQMMYAGETRIELVCPIRDDSPIAGFLAKRGPGLHHLAFAVSQCEGAIQHAQQKGARMIDKQPREGAHGTRIAFVHPASTGGVLTEMVEGGEGFADAPTDD